MAGIHEFGHSLFRILSGGNTFMTVIGGTFLEIFVPLGAFLYFQRKGQAISADICLLLLALSLNSVGAYAAAQQLQDEITLFNGAPDVFGDWEDYMHSWFGTKGHEILVRNILFGASALITSLALWALGSHIVRFIKEPPEQME